MDNDFEPVVGNWYTLVDDGQTFVVLTVDEDKGVVGIRYEDGDLEEVELGEWSDMDLEPAEPPEGWTPADDDLDETGLGFEEAAADAWKAPVAGAARPPRGKTWEEPDDDDDEDEDDDDYDEDWGEESDDD